MTAQCSTRPVSMRATLHTIPYALGCPPPSTPERHRRPSFAQLLRSATSAVLWRTAKSRRVVPLLRVSVDADCVWCCRPMRAQINAARIDEGIYCVVNWTTAAFFFSQTRNSSAGQTGARKRAGEFASDRCDSRGFSTPPHVKCFVQTPSQR